MSEVNSTDKASGPQGAVKLVQVSWNRCGHVTSSSLLDAHNCSPLKDSMMDMCFLWYLPCEFSVLLLLACAVPRASGFAVPAFWSWNACEFPKGMCFSFHAGDEDFGQEHCTKMFPTWWAAPASNSAAVSLYCCLLQCCPLPILPFLPKENAHWRADSSAQWRAVLKLVLSPGFRVLSRHEQEWMALVVNVQLW